MVTQVFAGTPRVKLAVTGLRKDTLLFPPQPPPGPLDDPHDVGGMTIGTSGAPTAKSEK